jgi:hypothetical protein
VGWPESTFLVPAVLPHHDPDRERRRQTTFLATRRSSWLTAAGDRRPRGYARTFLEDRSVGGRVLAVLDATALRRWAACALEALGREREHIDALNVFPVPDGDTGTNLFLTMEAARQAVGCERSPMVRFSVRAGTPA